MLRRDFLASVFGSFVAAPALGSEAPPIVSPEPPIVPEKTEFVPVRAEIWSTDGRIISQPVVTEERRGKTYLLTEDSVDETGTFEKVVLYDAPGDSLELDLRLNTRFLLAGSRIDAWFEITRRAPR